MRKPEGDNDNLKWRPVVQFKWPPWAWRWPKPDGIQLANYPVIQGIKCSHEIKKNMHFVFQWMLELITHPFWCHQMIGYWRIVNLVSTSLKPPPLLKGQTMDLFCCPLIFIDFICLSRISGNENFFSWYLDLVCEDILATVVTIFWFVDFLDFEPENGGICFQSALVTFGVS